MVIDLKGEKRPRKSHTGLYDEKILCLDCEEKFTKLDTYAHKHLIGGKSYLKPLKLVDGFAVDDIGRHTFFYLSDADPFLLTKFAMSILWRASVSDRNEVSSIKLGPYGDLYKDFISDESVCDSKNHTLILEYELDPVMRGQGIIIGRTALDGINFNRFIAGGYSFWLKADRRLLGSPFKEIATAKMGKQTVIGSEFKASKLGQQLSKGVKSSRGRFGDPWKGRYKSSRKVT
ncbi:MAG: hypothetical protein OEL78_01110 [Hyphomicrobiales bacterium]|nr:hypothetical protein [Hyphomicrobiales bacterium]